MSAKKKTSLKTAWYGVIMLATLLPLIILVPWVVGKAYRGMIESSLELQVEELHQVRDHIEHEVDNLVVLLHSKDYLLADNLKRAAGNKDLLDYDSLTQNIDSFFGGTQGLHSLTLFSSEGDALIHSDNPNITINYSLEHEQEHDFVGLLSRPEFVVPMYGRNFIGAPYPQEEGMFFVVSVPVGPRSDPLGVIRATIDIGGVWKGVEKRLDDRDALVYLIDSRGVLLNASKASERVVGGIATDLKIVRTLINSNDWSNDEEYAGLSGQRVFGTAVLLDKLAWGVVSELPVERITGPITKALISIVLFTLLLFSLCAIAGLWLVSRVLKPLMELSGAFAGVSGGDYSHKVATSTIAEIDTLASGFNAMVGAITEREEALRESEEALKKSETKYRLIHDTAFDGIIIADIDSNILEYNRSAEKIFGYDEDELAGLKLTALMPANYTGRHLNGIKRFNETGTSMVQGTVLQLEGLRKNGETFPLELIISSFDLNGNTVFSGTIRDITERKNSEESIKQLAYFDHLTGLPNRLLFIDRLDQVLLREAWKQRTAAVLFLDLDRFKVVNDTLGHAFGDELLKVVAARLQGCLREGDTVARLGGDEFTILLQGLAKADDVLLVLEKILKSIKRPVAIDGQEVVIGTSIGVSIFPDDGFDTDTLLKNADTAMYRAKSEGRNGFQLYSKEMSIMANKLLKMEHRLRKALEHNRFTIHYQPQLDLRQDTLFGAEALIRLADNEDGGLTPPGEFIPVAEETGLIIQLSEWVLKAVCTQNRSWQEAGYKPITVAVNISPKVFNQEYFVQTIADILKETGLDPKYLEIEITEETLLTDAEDTLRKMNALREIGVKFAIDDFGTGYSSLSYLKQLQVELLKIDRTFINDVFTNSDDKAIVKAIIQMAHNMGIDVLAEGVETDEQARFLKFVGCDKLQGYLYGKPVAHDELELLLKEEMRPEKERRGSA